MKEFDFTRVDRSKPWALFLDIDGTLVEFAATPDGVKVPPDLKPTLERLSTELKGGLAIITGRPIESADRLFPSVQFPMAGLHGGEFRFDGIRETVPAAVAPNSWRLQAQALTETYPGVSYEEKRFGFSVHYRKKPEAEPHVKAAMEEMVQYDNPGLHLLYASGAVEVRPDGIDKGSAIRRFMKLPAFTGRHALFFGDDTTDDDGFRAVQEMGGTTVLVGKRSPAEAEFVVSDPAAMRAMLRDLTLPA